MHPYHPLPAGENAPRESFSSQTIEDHGSELDHEGRPLVKGVPHKVSPGDGDSSLDNPLADYTHAELIELGTRFAKDKKLMNLTFVKKGKKIKFGGREDLTEDVSDDFLDDSESTLGLWAKAALLARDPAAFEHIEGLTDDDRRVLRHEVQHKWSHPWELYKMVAMSSMAAAVSGMDESVISGAQLFYPRQFGIDSGTGRDGWTVGLVNAAPYLCCSLIGCWLTEPLNNAFGRRGAIFVSAVICCVTCIWAAFTGSWWHLFIARFFLGLGIGPKSGTVPIYTAECSPTPIRGALVMMWQMWTAFGIMLGYVADLSFYKIADTPSIVGLNWRLMLGAAGFPAFLVAIQVWFSPESPRWLMAKGRYEEAYRAMYRLRGHELLAARDIFFIHVMLQEEEAVVDQSGNRWLELFTVPRVRRATLASSIVMFGQNAGGIGAVVYYCSTIFTQAGFSETAALTASWGFGVTNWLFALPAVYTIDTFGRRSLLLSTFPLMAIFLCVVGLAFFMNEANPSRIWVIASGIYAYAIVYSSGSGPVPFVLSAEVFPIAHREIGMSWATSVCWGFNFIVAITFPSLLDAYKPQGAFGWYATWNVVLWVLVLLFVPETKGLSLEELDMVFSVPTKKHASYSLKSIPWFIRRRILGQDVHQEPLYAFNSVESRATYGAKNEGGPTDRRRR